ncbi:hydantoinase/oxoprolinase family protein [Tautonia sociabilis]|uniref:H4MPT-linked C1 transfer pathway protein n=1 Tax=Tautonia sociabilis TaxID=2080755 RepID=A0A432MIS5_9BACT|nr:hydantoinase/oxoprolinase family protein [Tautonia sociabilis]RUL87263.1 H4MPT-linked C1 transfer pathway protein [Tautonia sociabilis]
MSPGDGLPLWLGLDIGGANIKAAHSNGRAISIPFELWKRPSDLREMLCRAAGLLPAADHLAVTMTAELCDCFATKAEGVSAILGAVSEAFPGRPVAVWGTEGRFLSVEEAIRRPELPAAANWLALATLAARLLPEGPGILIDIGSTTTDLIPLKDGLPAARGRTDTRRLQTGELVYAGVRRTPLMALAAELPHRGEPTALTAELFAATLDVYLTLGDIPPDPTNDSTPDGGPATVEAARDRLARMVAADRDSFSAEDAVALARAADEALMARLLAAANRACRAAVGPPAGAVVSGSGSFLARRLASRLLPPGSPVRSLDDAWGPLASQAGCAYAIVVLAAEQEPSLP